MDTYNMIDFNEKKGFICDMDGVIYHGNRVLPGVAEFIQWLHDENKEYLFLTNNSGYTLLFARYADEGDEPRLEGREAHRRELRRFRPHRKRHRACLPRARRAHRDGDRHAGVLLRQAEPADDAHGPQNAALPLSRGRHGR